MAKKKVKAEPDDNALRMAFQRHMFGLDGKSNSTVLGSRSFVGAGIPIPLAFQWQIDLNVLPVGLIYQLIGERGSRKTTFAFEVMRWIWEAGGPSSFHLTEGKFSYSLAHAILGYPDEANRPFVEPTYSPNLEGWQQDVMQMLKRADTAVAKGYVIDGKRYTGVYAPAGFVVDSIVAQMTQKQAETVEQMGGRERGYATHVKAISEWISTLQAQITCKPYLVLLINHCTVDRPTEFQVEIKEKGGRKLSFESSLIIILSCTKGVSQFLNEPGWGPEQETAVIKFALTKSSMGDDKRKLSVPILTRSQIVGPGQTKQRTWFMWGEALVNLVLAHMTKTEGVRISKAFQYEASYRQFTDAVRSVADFKVIGAGANRKFSCAKYADGEPLAAEQFGLWLQSDPEFVAMFYEQFGIKRYDQWPDGSEWSTFLQNTRAKLHAARALVPSKAVE